MLAGHPDAVTRLSRARPLTAGNPIAAAIVDRAAALPAMGATAMVWPADRTVPGTESADPW